MLRAELLKLQASYEEREKKYLTDAHAYLEQLDRYQELLREAEQKHQRAGAGEGARLARAYETKRLAGRLRAEGGTYWLRYLSFLSCERGLP